MGASRPTWSDRTSSGSLENWSARAKIRPARTGYVAPRIAAFAASSQENEP
jgi:hypothetical protein